MNICLIKQPAGLGDIIYCLKIPHILNNEYIFDRVIWPVVPFYNKIKDYIITDLNIEFVDMNTNFSYKNYYNLGNNLGTIDISETEKLIYIPLSTSDRIVQRCSCHNCDAAHGHIKYQFVNIDYHDWKKYVSIKRNYEREKSLIEHLNIDINSRYNFVNRFCGTFPRQLVRNDINPIGNNIYMTNIEGYTIFDWLGIIENADEIHTIECGLYYILEILGFENVTIYTKTKNLVQFDFCYMRDHCNKNWNYII